MHLIIINYGWPEQLCSTCSIIIIGNRWTTETTLAISYSQRPKVDYYFFFYKLSFHRSFKNNFLNKHETDNYFKDCCTQFNPKNFMILPKDLMSFQKLNDLLNESRPSKHTDLNNAQKNVLNWVCHKIKWALPLIFHAFAFYF